MANTHATFGDGRQRAKAADADRGTSTARGYGAEWRRMRLWILLRDCYRCGECKKVVSGTNAHVDHIEPLTEQDRGQYSHWKYQPSNLQTLCRACHNAKTNKEARKAK